MANKERIDVTSTTHHPECLVDSGTGAGAGSFFFPLCSEWHDCIPFIMKSIINGQIKKNKKGLAATIHSRAVGNVA